MKMKKKSFDYHFETLNPTDYRLTFTSVVKDSRLMFMFKHTMKTVKKKQGLIGETDVSQIMDIDMLRFKNLLKTIMTGTFKSVEKGLEEDGIVLLGGDLVKGYFHRESSKEWLLKLVFEGGYVDKR